MDVESEFNQMSAMREARRRSWNLQAIRILMFSKAARAKKTKKKTKKSDHCDKLSISHMPQWPDLYSMNCVSMTI